ncbi:MAG: hypothetical protein AAB573_05000, partial [Patescibacteria group bacterium]
CKMATSLSSKYERKEISLTWAIRPAPLDAKRIKCRYSEAKERTARPSPEESIAKKHRISKRGNSQS